jgi:hypothetical protein
VPAAPAWRPTAQAGERLGDSRLTPQHLISQEWSCRICIGVRSHFELVSAEPGSTPGSYVVTLTVTSDRFNGTGPLNFELRDGRIARLLIS